MQPWEGRRRVNGGLSGRPATRVRVLGLAPSLIVVVNVEHRAVACPSYRLTSHSVRLGPTGREGRARSASHSTLCAPPRGSGGGGVRAFIDFGIIRCVARCRLAELCRRWAASLRGACWIGTTGHTVPGAPQRHLAHKKNLFEQHRPAFANRIRLTIHWRVLPALADDRPAPKLACSG